MIGDHAVISESVLAESLRPFAKVGGLVPGVVTSVEDKKLLVWVRDHERFWSRGFPQKLVRIKLLMPRPGADSWVFFRWANFVSKKCSQEEIHYWLLGNGNFRSYLQSKALLFH